MSGERQPIPTEEIPWIGSAANRPDPRSESNDVILLWCRNCGEWAYWTIVEAFNKRRRQEGVAVSDATLEPKGGWECPTCDHQNCHDYAHATAWKPATTEV